MGSRYRSTAGMDVSCPESDGGHVFAPGSVDPLRRCEFCGLQGRGESTGPDGEAVRGFLKIATAERAAFFQKLRAPESAHGKPRKAGS